MEALRRVLRGVDTYTRWQGNFVGVSVVFLIGITLYDIIFRQFGVFTMWAFDVEWFTYAFILMLGMAYAALTDQHVRIDLATVIYPYWLREGIMVFSYAVIIIPLMAFIAKLSWTFAWSATAIDERTLIAWYAPIWPIKWFIFVGCVSMLPQCFAELIRHCYALVRKEQLG